MLVRGPAIKARLDPVARSVRPEDRLDTWPGHDRPTIQLHQHIVTLQPSGVCSQALADAPNPQTFRYRHPEFGCSQSTHAVALAQTQLGLASQPQIDSRLYDRLQ